MKSQEDKVMDLLSDGEYHCQTQFWDRYMRSPHKRRSGTEKKFDVKIENRKCIHGLPRSFDYRIIRPTMPPVAPQLPLGAIKTLTLAV